MSKLDINIKYYLPLTVHWAGVFLSVGTMTEVWKFFTTYQRCFVIDSYGPHKTNCKLVCFLQTGARNFTGTPLYLGKSWWT